MSAQRNDLTLYFKPYASIPEYRIKEAADYYHKQGVFDTPLNAYLYLLRLQTSDTLRFKHLISHSIFIHDKPNVTKDLPPPRKTHEPYSWTSHSQGYGEDEHMYFQRK